MEIFITLLATTATQFLKKYVYPKWGETGVHAVVFAIVFVCASIWYTAQNNQHLMEILTTSGKILIMAVGFYEVALKRILFTTLKEQGVEK